MHHDVVAIRKIVFESESIGRIAEQAGDKGNCNRSHNQFPIPRTPPQVETSARITSGTTGNM